MADTSSPSDARAAALFRTIGERLAAEPGHLADWFERRAAATPDAVVAVEEARSWTWRDLDGEANRIAQAGLATGLAPGATVATLLPNSVGLWAIILGLAKIGAGFSLLNPEMRGGALAHALDSVPPALTFAGGPAAAALAACGGAAGRVVVLGDGGPAAWCAAHPSVPPPAGLRAAFGGDTTLFHIFTSGTTGLPKAARCSHRRYILSATTEAAILGMTAADRMYVVLPMFHIAALSASGAAMSAGGSFLLRPRFSATGFWADVRQHGVTTLQYLGEIARYLVLQPARPDDRDHSLRGMIGAGLQADVWRTFQDRFGVRDIVECYGSSEGVCNFINLDGVVGAVGRALPGANRTRIVRHDGQSGEPVRDAQGRLIDCAPGEVGELVGAVGRGTVFEGYSSAEATRARLVPDPDEPDIAWFRTGDLFRRDAGGYLFFVDRTGDTYRWKGENVSTQQVTAALMETGLLRRAVVYGVRVPGAEGRAGMALVEPADGFEPARLGVLLAAALPAAAVPLFLRIGGSAGLTVTYKVTTADLQREGYGPRASGSLYLLERGAGYVPLDSASLARNGLPPFEDSDD